MEDKTSKLIKANESKRPEKPGKQKSAQVDFKQKPKTDFKNDRHKNKYGERVREEKAKQSKKASIKRSRKFADMKSVDRYGNQTHSMSAKSKIALKRKMYAMYLQNSISSGDNDEDTGNVVINRASRLYRNRIEKILGSSKAKKPKKNKQYEKHLQSDDNDSKSVENKKKRQKKKNQEAQREKEREQGNTAYARAKTNNATRIIHVQKIAAAKRSSILSVALVFAVIFMAFAGLLTSCTAMISAIGGEVTSLIWQSDPLEIDKAEEYYYQKELALMKDLNENWLNSEKNPGYDRYYFEGELYHDRMKLISYLSALFETFKAEDVYSELDALFFAVVSYRVETGTETDTSSVYNEDTGEWETVETEYTYYKIIMECRDIDDVVPERMSAEQQSCYSRYMLTRGGVQKWASPLAGWQDSITKYYTFDDGGMIFETTTGSELKAMQSGTVTEVGTADDVGNYIVIYDDVECYESCLGFMNSINVSEGDVVEIGQVVGTSTDKCYIDVSFMGSDGYQRYNPIFYVHNE